MSLAALPPDEDRRLERLRQLSVLDSAAEPLFDALTRAAAAVTGKPMALISLVDAERQWFKSRVGLPGISQTPRISAFCAHTILDNQIMEVCDMRSDSRFADNPLVTGDPHIRFYAGAPIVLDHDVRIGSLCVLDQQPGSLDHAQRSTLLALADAVAEALELRKSALDQQRASTCEAQALHQQADLGARLKQRLRASETFLERTGRLAGVGGWELDLSTRELTWSAETCRIHDLPRSHRPTLEQAIGFYAPKARPLMQAAVAKATEEGQSWDLELPLITAKGRKIWVRAVGKVEYDADGHPARLVGALQDVTSRKRVTMALEASERRFRKLFQYSMGLICTHDHEGILLSVNSEAADSLGYSIGEMIGCPLTDFIRPERHQAFRDYLLRMMTHDNDAGMLELVAKDGTLRYWQYHNVLDDEGDDPYVLGHAQDVTQREKNERKLREWSIRDPLTGCFNRRYMTELALDIAAQCWACIVIDLDYFKQVNDTQGHKRGDEVLVAMARFLTGRVRPDDAVIRLGGDEFLLLLRDADEGVMSSVVDRITRGRGDAPIGFTFGAVALERGVKLETGMAEADRRLYQRRAARGRTASHRACR